MYFKFSKRNYICWDNLIKKNELKKKIGVKALNFISSRNSISSKSTEINWVEKKKKNNGRGETKVHEILMQ